jgi:hypothetical protein
MADLTTSYIASGLNFPTGLTIGRDGNIYVAVNGLRPSDLSLLTPDNSSPGGCPESGKVIRLDLNEHQPQTPRPTAISAGPDKGPRFNKADVQRLLLDPRRAHLGARVQASIAYLRPPPIVESNAQYRSRRKIIVPDGGCGMKQRNGRHGHRRLHPRAPKVPVTCIPNNTMAVPANAG